MPAGHKPVRIALVALAAVALAGVLVAIGVSGGAGSRGQPSPARVEKEVSALLNGIPQSGDQLGQASAPITLQVFGDLESADVRTFMMWLLPDIIRTWVRTNIVKIQYRSFMNTLSHNSKVFMNQQVAALSAGTQNRLWNFIETFYHEQGKEGTPYVTERYLGNIAEQIPGLNFSQWETDRESNQLTKQVVSDYHAARAVGFYDTPAFLIGRTGEQLIPWRGYRLYEQPGPEGKISLPIHPLSFMTAGILKRTIEHLP